MKEDNYKWSWGVDQRAIIESGLRVDIVDYSILRMLVDFATSEFCKKIQEGGETYYFFHWTLIRDQLPILNLNTRQSVNKRIRKLATATALYPHKDNKKTRNSWFKFGEGRSLLIDNKRKQKVPKGNESYDRETKVTKEGNESLHNTTTSNNIHTKEDFEALKLLRLIEEHKKTIFDFCEAQPDQLTLICANAMFKGDYKEQVPSFVEYYMDTLNFRENPLRFFCQKFASWLRNAKQYKRPKGKKVNRSSEIDYKSHLEKNLKEKQLKSLNGQIAQWIKLSQKKGMFAKIDALKKELQGVSNSTYTHELVFDFCYGSISKRSGSGTTPERAMSKFRQFYHQLSEYKQNQSNLRTEYFNYLVKHHG